MRIAHGVSRTRVRIGKFLNSCRYTRYTRQKPHLTCEDNQTAKNRTKPNKLHLTCEDALKTCTGGCRYTCRYTPGKAGLTQTAAMTVGHASAYQSPQLATMRPLLARMWPTGVAGCISPCGGKPHNTSLSWRIAHTRTHAEHLLSGRDTHICGALGASSHQQQAAEDGRAAADGR